MNYYDSELQRLQSEIMEKQRTDAKLSDLFLQQSDLEKRTDELEKIMRKEQDVSTAEVLQHSFTEQPGKWVKN